MRFPPFLRSETSMLVKIRLNGELERQDENQNQQGAKITASPEVAQLLEQVREGSRSALNRLTSLLYRELQRLAKRRLLAQPNGHTLGTSDLVNETYLKLANVRAPDWRRLAGDALGPGRLRANAPLHETGWQRRESLAER